MKFNDAIQFPITGGKGKDITWDGLILKKEQAMIGFREIPDGHGSAELVLWSFSVDLRRTIEREHLVVIITDDGGGVSAVFPKDNIDFKLPATALLGYIFMRVAQLQRADVFGP